jgi:hypothetical protein
MFGGLLVAGPWGLLLGPLLARLAREGLILMREERDRHEASDEERPSSEPEEPLGQTVEQH